MYLARNAKNKRCSVNLRTAYGVYVGGIMHLYLNGKLGF